MFNKFLVSLQSIGEAYEVLSLRQGPVRLVQILQTPRNQGINILLMKSIVPIINLCHSSPVKQGIKNILGMCAVSVIVNYFNNLIGSPGKKDDFASTRPLFAVCDAAR